MNHIWCRYATTTRLAFAVAAGVLVLAGPRSVTAQVVKAARSNVKNSPDSIAQRYIVAMRNGDWGACARLMHRESVSQIRLLLNGLQARDPSGEGVRNYFGIGSADSLRVLSDVALFERLLRTVADREPTLRSVLQSGTMTVIGHVNEGTELAHVLYRMRVEVNGTAVTKVDVLSLRRQSTEWRVLLTQNVQNAVDAVASPRSR